MVEKDMLPIMVEKDMLPIRAFLLILAAVFTCFPWFVRAEDAVVIEIADTGLALPNHALGQDRHYLKQDDDLLGRIACLMQDMDSLLVALHALPPELAGTVLAEKPAADELGMLIQLALSSHPELAAYRSKLAVQAAQTRQAGAKLDPMVSFNLASFPLPQLDAGDVPMTQYVMGWSQKYEGYGKRGLRREIASVAEDITVLDLEQRELAIIGELTDLYYAMASVKSRLRVLEDNRELLGLLIQFAESKYALGRTPQAQVLQAQTRLAKLEEQQLTLENLLKRQQELLKGLLGHPEGFDPSSLALALEYPMPALLELDDLALLKAALAQRPDYQRLDVQQHQQELQVELAHRGYRPDYTVSASYGLRYGKRDFFSAGVSIPLFTHKAERQDAALQEAYAALDVTDSSRGILENALATQLGTLQADIGRIVEISRLYRDGLVPQARLALDSTIAGYAANQVDLADLLMAQQTLLSYELELEQLYIEYLAALSKLQVLTAGVFDPQPYLAPDPGLAEDSAAFTIQLDELAEPAVPVAPDALHQIDEATEQVPALNPRFIKSLSLPAAVGNGQTEVAVPPEAGDAALPADAGLAPSEQDDFYTPYSPPPKEDRDD
jgi:cobalt-zinc-cadmium efflux system outer membrane protein